MKSLCQFLWPVGEKEVHPHTSFSLIVIAYICVYIYAITIIYIPKYNILDRFFFYITDLIADFPLAEF